MKKICLCCLALLCLTNLFAQETVNYKEKKPNKTWVINKLPAVGLKTSICLPN